MKELMAKHKDEMLQKWVALVEKYGAAIEEEKMYAAAEYIKELFEAEGFECELKDTGDNTPKAVVGTRDCDKDSKPVIFSGHYDTVFKSDDWNTVEIIDGSKLHGPGALDMKGGIITALFAARIVKEAGNNMPLKIIFVGDEEIGHTGSYAAQLLEEEAKNARCAFNMETGFMNNDVCIGRKGTAIAELEISGVSSHPGNAFEKGRNAIVEAAKKIAEIEKLTDLEQGVSASVNTISGGTASNVIPNFCKVQVDLRFSTYDQYIELSKKIADICGEKYIEDTETKIKFVEAIMPFEYTQREEQLYKAVAKAAERVGQRVPQGLKRGGASDAAYLQRAGIPVICAIGVSGENSHSKEEYAVIGSLADRAELLAYFLMNIDDLQKEEN